MTQREYFLNRTLKFKWQAETPDRIIHVKMKAFSPLDTLDKLINQGQNGRKYCNILNWEG